MTRREISRHKKALTAQRVSLTQEIGRLRKALVLEFGGDEVDRVRALAERSTATREIEVLAQQLRGVEGALREIEDGTFGVCASCGREIRPQRLAAVPWSPYCISCQRKLESRRKEVAGEPSQSLQALAS